MSVSENRESLLAVTMGDPSGVGCELLVRLFQERAKRALPPLVWFGDPRLLNNVLPYELVSTRKQALEIWPNALPIVEIKCAHTQDIAGKPDKRNAESVLQSIERAVQWTKSGETDGVVTAPITKNIFGARDLPFTGHTDFIASLCDVENDEVMMLANDDLKVALVTAHIPMRRIFDILTADLIVEKALITHRALKRDFGIKDPHIAVAGLNPHAGEGGMLGAEDAEIIAPAIERLKTMGVKATGPYPPDTLFTPTRRTQYDVALCMYHDQGLIPLKTLDMEHGVNITLGLPIIRTSPDHGTAFDIARGAGKEGIASPESFYCAIRVAREMAQHKAKI